MVKENNSADEIRDVDEKKLSILDRCWIFKSESERCLDKVDGTRKENVLKASPAPSDKFPRDNRYDEHRKFLIRLSEYQATLPKSHVEDVVVSGDVTFDTDMTNLFINNHCDIRSSSSLNVKLVMGLDKQNQNELEEDVMRNRSGSRFLRVRQPKQKIPNDILIDDEDSIFSLKTKKNVENNNDECVEIKSPTKKDSAKKSVFKVKKRKIDVTTTDKIKAKLDEFDNDEMERMNKLSLNKKKKNPDVIEIDNNFEVTANVKKNKTASISCPMCNELFSYSEINNHAYSCQGPQSQSQNLSSKVNDYGDSNFDNDAWENACKGLKETHQPKPFRDESNFSTGGNTDLNIFKSSRLSLNTKSRTMTKSEVKKLNENFSAKKSVFADLKPSLKASTSRIDTYNNNSNDLFKTYTKTMNRIKRKNPPAKQLRTFGEPLSDDENDMIKCAKCDELIPNDQLIIHTDNCINDESLLVE